MRILLEYVLESFLHKPCHCEVWSGGAVRCGAVLVADCQGSGQQQRQREERKNRGNVKSSATAARSHGCCMLKLPMLDVRQWTAGGKAAKFFAQRKGFGKATGMLTVQ